MKMITASQQDEALIHLNKLSDALMSEDEIKRIDAIEHIAELAYIIGGLELMHMVRISQVFQRGG